VIGIARIAPIPESAEIINPWTVNTRFSRTSSNYHIESSEIVMDLETRDSILDLAIGLPYSAELVLAAEAREIAVIGLDRFTVNFHNLFNIEQDDRLATENDRTYVSIPSLGIQLDGSNIDNPISQRFNAQLRKRLFATKGGLATSLGVLGSTENRKEVKQSKKHTDMVYQLFFTLPFYANALHLNANYIVPQKVSTGLELDPGWMFTAAMEVEHFGSLATILQVIYSEPVIHNMGQLSKPSYEIILGESIRIGQMSFEFGIFENAGYHLNTADWSLFYGAGLKI
jgi:hypothetical protein